MLAQTLVEQFIGQGFRVVFPSDATRQTKFWPATGATAKPRATIGMKPAWPTRWPMPKPACAAAPKGWLTT